MATGAVGAVATLVDIVAKVAGDALLRRPCKAIANVAAGASRRLMRTEQPKAGRRMVEFVDILPSAFAVAGGAILAEAVVMDILFGMACDASGGRDTEFRAGRMAVRAGHAAMFAMNGEVGPAMIEARPLQVHGELDGTPMLEMTGTALLRRGSGRTAMEAGVGTQVASHARMAGLAFAILRRWGEGIVAGRAARFDLRMSGT